MVLELVLNAHAPVLLVGQTSIHRRGVNVSVSARVWVVEEGADIEVVVAAVYLRL